MTEQTDQTHKMINGYDTDKLGKTISMLQESPELGQFKFRVRNEWVDGAHCRTHIKDFYGAGREDDSRTGKFAYDEDEPPILLGANRGANPVEYALTALAGCLMTGLTAHAAARGIALRSVESELEGDLDVRGFLGIDPSVRNGYQNIRVTFHIDADATEQQIQELVKAAQDRSPVFDIVTHETPVTVGYERVGTPQAPAA